MALKITKQGHKGSLIVTKRAYAVPVPYRKNGSSGGSGQKGYLVKSKSRKA